MSHSVVSRRQYRTLADFWRMVSRSAFTQLRYSAALLIGTTVVDGRRVRGAACGYRGGAWAQGAARARSARRGRDGCGLRADGAFLRPAVASWALTLPVAAALFLAMTWSSAVNYWRGTRATWKNRSYESPD